MHSSDDCEIKNCDKCTCLCLMSCTELCVDPCPKCALLTKYKDRCIQVNPIISKQTLTGSINEN